MGFSRKDHCKVLLEKHFTIDIHYKITLYEEKNSIIEVQDTDNKAPEHSDAIISAVAEEEIHNKVYKKNTKKKLEDAQVKIKKKF